MSDMRERFEAVMQSEAFGYGLEWFEKDQHGDYIVEEIEYRWQGFQAAYQAAAPQWMPLETVPRHNKTEVLCWSPVFGVHVTSPSRIGSATHWMYLPQAPKEPT